MPESSQHGDRLDSWKAIALYLKRDVATVRRWETTLGLPVRRVAGSGRSVFAYKSEIDAWLETDAAIDSASTAPAAGGLRRARWSLVAVAALLAIAAIGAAILLSARARRTAAPGDLRLDVTPAGVVARGTAGEELWRHPFPADPQTAIPTVGRTWLVVGGTRPAAYVVTSHTDRRADQQGGDGKLLEFSVDGTLRRSFSFDDEFTFGGKRYGPPWAVTSLAVDDSAGTRRIAVAGHHFTWHPSPVTILDENWRRLGTFVHAGWVEALEWLSPDRLLIAGYSNARDGGMVALLDPGHLDGQGPEEPETRYYCEDCGTGRPVRMVVMPRTEVNLASAWHFNRALILRVGDRILARTVELEMAAGDADVVYEFSSTLELVGASFSDRYWEAHRTLEADGKLDHSRDQCPDRAGPRQYLAWTAATGWQSIAVR